MTGEYPLSPEVPPADEITIDLSPEVPPTEVPLALFAPDPGACRLCPILKPAEVPKEHILLLKQSVISMIGLRTV